MASSRLNYLLFIYISHLGWSEAFNLFQPNRVYVYNFTGSVQVGARESNSDHNANPTWWRITGLFQMQRIDSTTLAAWITPHGEVNIFPPKHADPKRMWMSDELRAPFKIIIANNGAINYVAVNAKEKAWTSNFKRAFASTFQLQVEKSGLFTMNEGGLHGFCSTSYLVTNRTTHWQVRKTVDLNSCSPHGKGIHHSRINVPNVPCLDKTERKVVVSNEGSYELRPNKNSGVFVSKATMKGVTLVNIFESTGSAQYINSELEVNFVKERMHPKEVSLDVDKLLLTSLEYVNHNKDPTAGRNTATDDHQIRQVVYLLNYLTDALDAAEVDFEDPIDSHVAETFRVIGFMEFEALEKLFKEIDIGTSYRQETIRNLFFEFVSRVGTRASVLLTRDLVVKKSVKPTTAVQLLMALPFHIDEMSQDLARECEILLSLGSDRPDVKQAAVLSYATLIHHTFVGGKMTVDVFERYVKKYFDLFFNSPDYEQQMLYLLALTNLELGNVVEYLEPIVKGDYPQNTDIRFLAIWSTLSLAHVRPEKTYELYWPILESRDAPLQLRVAALMQLLMSKPSPARLMSIHEYMLSDNCPHLRNFYRTTILGLKKTTHPCYENMKDMMGFLSRHLPLESTKKYWTGNYMDGTVHQSAIGIGIQSLLIADDKTDIPEVVYLRLDTESLRKYTGKFSVFVKIRGLAELIEKIALPIEEIDGLRSILNGMRLHPVPQTPLHLEFVLNVEGKAVLSYYINQTTIMNITEGDIITRLQTLIMGETHINMQTIRWPFMNRYSVPTVLGTPAEVVIESTVATAVRGNITFPNHMSSTMRNHQIDMRYSSYSTCLSRSYNPFLNYEHQVQQDQGFLGFKPINSELSLNMVTGGMSISFIRPKQTTSGFALKSRISVNIREFLLLDTDTKPANPFVFVESEDDKSVSVLDWDIADLGTRMQVSVGMKKIVPSMFDFTNILSPENGNVPQFAGQALQTANILQVITTHLGNYKNIKWLVKNEQDSKILLTLNLNHDDGNPDLFAKNLNMELMHTSDLVNRNATPTHRWSAVVRLMTTKSTGKHTIQASLTRISNLQDWRLCLEGYYVPLVYAQSPGSFKTTATFGQITEGSKSRCPQNKSVISVTGSFDVDDSTKKSLQALQNDEQCPGNLVKFTPPMLLLQCKDRFSPFTKITDLSLQIKPNRMPSWYNDGVARLQHLYSTFMSYPDTSTKEWAKGMDVKVTMPPARGQTVKVDVNGAHLGSLAHFSPFYRNTNDIKYNQWDTRLITYGIYKTCSVAGGTLHTFAESQVELSKMIVERNKKPCALLLAADCTSKTSFAVFLQPIAGSGLAEKFAIKYFVGQTSVAYSPDDPEHVVVNNPLVTGGDLRMPIRNLTLTRENHATKHLWIHVTPEDILEISDGVFFKGLQFDRKNLLQMSTSFNLRSKVCGLCNPESKSSADSYSYCFKS
ncbi:vitellogenin-2 [Phlebotomus argentipes]|uniref:vitellogenin-2 n=1 Tax=Phlebotomus argentipes TaxID=94469 RepID=UPI002892B415|nr:vitellogenin-2 [Phlebotomus argentipes]